MKFANVVIIAVTVGKFCRQLMYWVGYFFDFDFYLMMGENWIKSSGKWEDLCNNRFCLIKLFIFLFFLFIG